jgi:tetratricopeptide (TPR) repeat protein
VTLERARAIFTANQQADPVARMLFFARMGRLIAEALDAQPDGRAIAAEARQKTLRQFEQLIDGNRLAGSRIAEAEVERGKLLYQSGDREPALEALRRAADLAAGTTEEQGRVQAQVYVDILAFLVPRGELDESVSMYHRALGRVRLPESMKVYCSLWINDLLVRAGQLTDPLADGLLKSMQGGKWPAELARWASGRLSEAELLGRADSQGKQAEANFYLGLARLRAGDRVQAEQHFRKVVDTQMLGYFEYEMSSLYLKQGVASPVPSVPVSPSLAPQPPRPVAPPAGSI